jgi:DNA-directed RNA polymerase specialized sigma24 family protein
MAEGTTSPMSKSASAEAIEKPPAVKPLTRWDYERLPAVEQQIREALALTEASLIARTQIRDETSADYLSAEALVYLIRHADSNGNRKIRDTLFRELFERCLPFFRGKFRGFTKEEQEDLQQNVMAKVVEHLLAPGDIGDFMQVRFWKYLQARTMDACRTAFRHADDTESLDTGYFGNGEVEGRTKLESQEARELTPEQWALLLGGLSKLPPRLRQVFILRHRVGMKIDSDAPADDGPGEITLASRFNCTGRTIRNWLKEADNLLAGFREKQDYDA